MTLERIKLTQKEHTKLKLIIDLFNDRGKVYTYQAKPIFSLLKRNLITRLNERVEPTLKGELIALHHELNIKTYGEKQNELILYILQNGRTNCVKLSRALECNYSYVHKIIREHPEIFNREKQNVEVLINLNTEFAHKYKEFYYRKGKLLQKYFK